MLIMGEHIKSIIVYFPFSNRSDISVAVDAPPASSFESLPFFFFFFFNASSVKHVKRHVLLESPWSILGGVW